MYQRFGFKNELNDTNTFHPQISHQNYFFYSHFSACTFSFFSYIRDGTNFLLSVFEYLNGQGRF